MTQSLVYSKQARKQPTFYSLSPLCQTLNSALLEKRYRHDACCPKGHDLAGDRLTKTNIYNSVPLSVVRDIVSV